MSDVQALGQTLFLFVFLFLVTFTALFTLIWRCMALEAQIKSLKGFPQGFERAPGIENKFQCHDPAHQTRDSKY